MARTSPALFLESLDRRDLPNDVLGAAGMVALPAVALLTGRFGDLELEGGTEAERYGFLSNDSPIQSTKAPRFEYQQEDNGESHESRGNQRYIEASATKDRDKTKPNDADWGWFPDLFGDEDDGKDKKNKNKGDGGGVDVKPIKSAPVGVDSESNGGGRAGGGGSADSGAGFTETNSSTSPQLTTDNGLLTTQQLTTDNGPLTTDESAPNHQELATTYAQLPMQFEENVGQTDASVEYLARGPGYTLFLGATSAVLTLQRPNTEISGQQSAVSDQLDPLTTDNGPLTTTLDVLAVTFAGANADAKVAALDLLDVRSNYFTGSDPAGHFTNIANFAKVQTESLYDGIDLVHYGNSSGLLEYDFILAPGADVKLIRMEYQGATSMQINAAGDLVLQTETGEVTHKAPIAYQKNDDGTRASNVVTARFKINGVNEVGLKIGGNVDASKETIIDPVLDYSSYLGGSGNDIALGIAVDGSGSAYVTGSTTSTNFPVLDPFQSMLKGTQDAFVARFAPDGKSLVFSTYVGGTTGSFVLESGNAIAVDLEGNAYVTGVTGTTDFPTTTGAFQTSLQGMNDVFAFKLAPTGDILLYSTLLGGTAISGTEEGRAIAVDPFGQAVVAGVTPGSSFDVTAGAFQTTFGGGTMDAFVAKLAADGKTLIYSSYLGGTGIDAAEGIAPDDAFNAYVVGSTTGSFPTTAGVVQQNYGGGVFDGFAVKVNDTGSTKTYATYLGGIGDDKAFDVAVDLAGYAYVTGHASAGFPTTAGAYRTTNQGGLDAFLSKLNATASALSASSFLGGSANDTGYGVALTQDNKAIVAGVTSSTNFPTQNPLQTDQGLDDGFISKFNTAVSALDFSTYHGGSGADQANDVALDLFGAIYVTGQTMSSNFPTTTGAYQTGYAGNQDGFVSKILDGVTATPAITAISTDSGSYNNDFITTDQTLTLSGTANIGASVEVYRSDVSLTSALGTVTADGSGNWTFDYSATTLPEGDYPFTTRSSLSGVFSEFSGDQVVTVDLTSPTITLSSASSTTSLQPTIEVYATDRNGLLPGANNFIYQHSDGTIWYLPVLATLPHWGWGRYLVPINNTGNWVVRASIGDLAGNIPSYSNEVPITINPVTNPWTVTTPVNGSGQATIRTSELHDGMSQEQLGNLRLAHGLDLDQSPGAGGFVFTYPSSGMDGLGVTDLTVPALVYNSNHVNARPVVHASVQLPNSGSLPSTITATLTWNSVQQSPVNFSTAGFNPGEIVTLAVQVANPVIPPQTTGRYTWSLRIYASGYIDTTINGYAFVRVEDASAFGAGWTLLNLNKLVPIAVQDPYPAGQLWLYGEGSMRFFTGTSGTLTSPAEDNGTLVKNGDGTFTYTSPEQVKIYFDSQGRQTKIESPDTKEKVQFAYDGQGRLQTLTAIDGAQSTFTYGNGGGQRLSLISTAGGRSYNFQHNGLKLEQIKDPDTDVVRTHDFTYSATYKLESETRGILQNQYRYASTGLLDRWTWGSTLSPSIVDISSIAGQGLSGLVRQLEATATDSLGNVTRYTLDEKARPLRLIAADGGNHVYTRYPDTDPGKAGKVQSYTDPVTRKTDFTRDAKGYVTTISFLAAGTSQVYDYDPAWHTLTLFRDERGFQTTYAYDPANGRRTSMTLPVDGTWTYQYYTPADGNPLIEGLLKTITEPAPTSRVTTLLYDNTRRLTDSNDVWGNTHFTYAAITGEVATVRDPKVRTTTMFYDDAGRLLTVIDPLPLQGNPGAQVWVYNSAGLLHEYINKNVHGTRLTYDAYGRGIVEVTREGTNSDKTRSFVSSLDIMGQVIGDRDARGYSNSYTLDPMGRAVRVTNPLRGVSKNLFNRAGELTFSRNPLGYWTGYAYNGRGWLSSVTDARNQVWTHQWDNAGNFEGVRAPGTQGPYVTYDGQNRRSAYNDGDGNTTNVTYWSDGRVYEITDPYNVKTQFTYNLEARNIIEIRGLGLPAPNQMVLKKLIDDTGLVMSVWVGPTVASTPRLVAAYILDEMDRIKSAKDGMQNETKYEFDMLGNVVKVTDPLNKVTEFGYDGLERQWSTKDPNNNTQFYWRDPMDNPIGSLDGEQHLWTAAYDDMGNNIWQGNPERGYVRQVFNVAGWLRAVKDPVGNKTSYQHGPTGLVTQQVNPLGKVTTFTHTPAGQVDVVTDPLGKVKDHAYYPSGLLEKVEYKDTANGPVVNTKSYTYNKNQLLLTAGDQNGTYTLTYDELSREKTQLDPHGITITSNYDPNNFLLDTVTDNKVNGTLDYDWDGANRLDVLKYSDANNALNVNFDYNSRNDLTEIRRYSDLGGTNLVSKTIITPDDGRRITNIRHEDANGVAVNWFAMVYDMANRITSETSLVDGARTNGYDRSNQLISSGAQTFAWDPNGNSANPGFQNSANNRVVSNGTWTYFYNDAGNITNEVHNTTTETWNYFYNGDNQMVKAEHKATSLGPIDKRVEFLYDVFGNRIRRTLDNDGDGPGAATVEKFAYDRFGNAWADLNSSGSLTTRRIFGLGMDQLIARIYAGYLEDWYLTDLRGSVTDIINANGAVIDHVSYTAFGTIANETSHVDGDRYKYTGREWEPETGLYYYRARYYNATIMRFMSEDPLGFGAGDPNLSRYVNNNSPNATDPGGTIAFVPLLIWGGTALLISGLGYANVQYRVAAARYDNAFELGQGQLTPEREEAFQRELAAARWSHAQGNRGMGAAQIGGALMTAGAAGSLFGLGSSIVGSVLAVNAVDNFQAGVRTLITGEHTRTMTEALVSEGAQALGASRETGDTIGAWVNVGIQVAGGGYATFRAWRAARATQATEVAGRNWQRASLQKAIEAHAGPRHTTWRTSTGKQIFENPGTGRQVVVDLQGGYFRIFQPNTIGSEKGTYLNLLGNEVRPARFMKNGSIGNPRLRDIDKGLWQQETHFFIS